MKTYIITFKAEGDTYGTFEQISDMGLKNVLAYFVNHSFSLEDIVNIQIIAKNEAK